MWLVNAALRNPYAVYVGMLLVLVLGIVSYQRTPTDILPQIKVPVVVVFASYRGMPAPDMEKSVTAPLERALTRCDHLDHIESRSLLGIGIIKVYFRPQVDPDVASSQVISLVQGEMQNMPPGMLPPSVLKYDASSIPVGNLIISSSVRGDKELLDLADHELRDELSGIEGLASAPVFGGVFRQVQIYVHPRTLQALRLSPMDVARAVNAQSQVIPTGEMRIGDQTYYVSSNSMAATPKDFEKIPLWSDGRKIVYLGDVASVVDATRWRTNTVHVNGKRAVYMPLLRQAGASAVRVVDNVKDFLPHLHRRGTIPADVEVEVAFDQSQYVRDALANLRMEGVLGAVLASLVVLLFLGSLRSTWVVALSIPLSVMAAFLGLYFLGHTLNIMTLGGLALILGRVVDDTIVDVENTVRHLNMGKTPLEAVRASAAEIATPILMATLTTVIVFFPLTFLTGVGKYLFTPLAVSATLAMVASYLVSRTVSPLYCAQFLRPHHEKEHYPRWVFLLGLVAAMFGLGLPALLQGAPGVLPESVGVALIHAIETLPGWVLQAVVALGAAGALAAIVGVLFWSAPRFDRAFERFSDLYEVTLRLGLRHRLAVLALVGLAIVPAVWCFNRTGQELFPEVDASDFTLHIRLKGGPRVEATEKRVAAIQKLIREGYVRREPLPQNLTPERRAAYEADGYVVSEGHLEKRIPPLIPPEDLDLLLANIGLSSRWSAIYTPNNGPHAAFIRVQLRSGFGGRTTPMGVYVERLRSALAYLYPGDDFFFETGGIIRSILNAGALAPIEVQVHGRETASRVAVARFLDARISRIPQVRETYRPQGMDLPQLKVDVDREAAARLKLTENDVLRNVIAALMSSAQLAPNFWIDPTSGNPYIIGVQYPENLVENVQTLENIPVTSERNPQRRAPLLREVAKIERTQAPVEVYHFSVSRVNQLFISIAGNDLARVADEVHRIVAQVPIEYALWKLPREKLLTHAMKVFPREQGDPTADAELRGLLVHYFKEDAPELAEDLRERYGVEAATLDLARDPAFRALLERYFDTKRQSVRAQIKNEYDIDPAGLHLPAGINVELRGEIKTMEESFREMAFNLILAVLLVYLVMAAQFSSWLDPLVMIVAAPLGLIGVTVMLWATGTSLNVQSAMGVLMMIGISVSNSVLVIEFANRLREEERLAPLEAVLRACRVRMRPIVMTTLATVVGLLPMAIHLHPGDEMNLPLARAVIGGLLGSTLLTLYVVPVLYVLLKPREVPSAETPAPAPTEL